MATYGPSGELIDEKASAAGAMSVPTFGLQGLFPSLWSMVREPFAGAWQRNIVAEAPQNLLAFSAVYACIALRADDISKLRPRIMVNTATDGITVELVSANNPLGKVLDKPNVYQTRIQFFAQWITSKLMFGNTYVLKERDARGVVIALHVLDPRTVQPLVAPDGSVWYALRQDYLAGVIGDNALGVAAKEIIHDRCNCFFHPLVGLSPIYACGSSATQGIRIQANSERFFQNMSAPSGVLTSPSIINEETLALIKRQAEEFTSGKNIGKLLVVGDGLQFKSWTMPATDAQLIDQLKWTVDDVARAFKVPGYKLGGTMPTFNNAGVMNTDYYTQTLQADIEAIEVLLEEGLTLPPDYCVEFDLDALMRLDPLTRAEVDTKEVSGGVQAPNEARAKRNLGPVTGGEKPFMQQQNFPIDKLAARPPPADGGGGGGGSGSDPPKPAPPDPAPTAADEPYTAQAGSALRLKLYKEALVNAGTN